MEHDEWKQKLNEQLSKLPKIRGEIVEAAINVDTLLSAILANYFVPSERQSDFLTKFLCHEQCTSFLKIAVIHRLGLLDNHKNVKKLLEDLFYYRNLVAHSMPMASTTFPSVFSSKEKKTMNLEEIHKTFFTNYEIVSSSLQTVLNSTIKENDLEPAGDSRLGSRFTRFT